ncbi:MAG: sterol desaturase family protein [Pseudomonadales bacterium]|nr:sterol desaturase family protein [Pseudomonadales bacterium]
MTKRHEYRLNDTVNSLAMGTMSRLMGLVRLGVSATLYEWFLADYTLLPITTDSAIGWVVCFVLYDLCYYFSHRYGHEWRILWAAHVVHHQSEEFNLSTALRQTSTGWLNGIFYIPLYIIGFPADMLVAVGSLNLIYQFWVHTEHVRRLGVLDYVLVTPSNHRVHHAKNPCYIDRNYGGVFILWDRLFGTFEDEREDEPCVYGITDQLASFNPVWGNLHVYLGGLKDMWHATRWQDKLLLWFRGPGFHPEGTHHAPHDWRAPKYDPPASAFVKRYAFIHFWLLVIATFVVLGFADRLSTPMVTACALVTVFGYVVNGAMLEGRRYARALEVTRLTAIAGLAWLLLGNTAPVWSGVVLAITAISAALLLFASPNRASSSPLTEGSSA